MKGCEELESAIQCTVFGVYYEMHSRKMKRLRNMRLLQTGQPDAPGFTRKWQGFATLPICPCVYRCSYIYTA